MWEPFPWYCLLPAILCMFYGYTQHRSIAVLRFTSPLVSVVSWLAVSLFGTVLVVGWSLLGFPLPIFYILIYLFQTVRLLGKGPIHMKNWFLLNLSYVNTMTLHLILIGAAALFQNVTMHTLLLSPFWRAVSVSFVLAVSLAEDLVFLWRPHFSDLITAEAESLEVRPFMAFLWFCTGYLLVDSLLCAVELEVIYPPLFLLGSSAVLMYFLIRFLLHINDMIHREHLKDEHDQLSAQLEATQESAGTLKRIVDRDALTGVFSRRYAMDQINGLITAGDPFSLVFLDLDGLKQINDQGGHDAGDRYLIHFTQAMAPLLRPHDTLARVGGDEFVILMPGCGIREGLQRTEDIREKLEDVRKVGEVFRFSYGITPFLPGDKIDAEALLRDADRAMYQDKAQRR